MAATAQAAKSKSPEQAAAQANWFVRDNCFPKDKANDKKFIRHHDIEFDRDGNVVGGYDFRYGEKVRMPVRHATRFANIPGFTVWDEGGKLVEPLRAVTGDSSVKGLKPHETVATYAELATDSLVARCRRLPNGAAFHSKSPRPVMIDFLMSGGVPPVQKVADLDAENFGTSDPDADPARDDGTDMIEGGDDDGDASLADGILSAND